MDRIVCGPRLAACFLGLLTAAVLAFVTFAIAGVV